MGRLRGRGRSGTPRVNSRTTTARFTDWRGCPTAAGVIYSSSRGTTMPYLPTQALWEVDLDGGEARPIAPADLSYLHPDVHAGGTMVASRLRMQFDLWKYPTDGRSRRERAARASHHAPVRTGANADGRRQRSGDRLPRRQRRPRECLGDGPETGELRQITYERDPSVALGVPIWSPDGKWIAFVSSRGNTGLGFGVWLVGPDGGNLRKLAAARPRRHMVSGRAVGLLRRRRRALQGPDGRRIARARQAWPGAQRRRVRRQDAVLHGRSDAHRCQPGVRDSRRDAGRCAVARARADSGEPGAAVANHQSGALA